MSNPPLSQVLDIPLGAVLKDEHGVPHIFVGRARGAGEWSYYFQPEVTETRRWTPSTYSFLASALAKFPHDLQRFLPEGRAARIATGVSAVEVFSAIADRAAEDKVP